MSRGDAIRPRLPSDVARRLREGEQEIVVTGASGWLGRATLALLDAALGADAFDRRVRAFASAAKSVDAGSRDVAARPLDELADGSLAGALLLHFAYRTREQEAEVGPAVYLRDNLAISSKVVEAAEATPPAGLLLASSGAVYAGDGRLACDLGANPYGTLKHLDELALATACRQGGTRLVIARIFNVSGPPMPRAEAYALGSLIGQALAGGPLVIRARGPVRRSFVAIADLVAIALAFLLDSDAPAQVTFDAAGEEVVEVGELAERVAAVLDVSPLAIERTLDAGARPDYYVGDPERLAVLAAEYGIRLTPLDEQICQTAAALAPAMRRPAPGSGAGQGRQA